MRNFFLLAILFVAVSLSQSATAVERIDEPLTFRHAMNWKSNAQLFLGPLDMQKIAEEDALKERQYRPKRIAIARVEKSGENYERNGEWSEVDAMSVWRLKVNAVDADWLSFSFTNLFLPPGASLYVYNESREQVSGPYTDKDNKPSGNLWTPMVHGQIAYIEINVPTKTKPYLSFDLKSVNHGYKGLKDSPPTESGACNIDVVCPQGDGWRDQIRSVGTYFFEREDGFFVCTGNLVNNVEQDREAYFLTASHCATTAAHAESMVIYWNYATSVCGGSPDGSTSQAQSGATLLATLYGLYEPEPKRDMTLVRLDSTPDRSFNVYWTGWDSSSVLPDSGVGIHHPGGFEKRISIDSGPVLLSNYSTGAESPTGSHLKVVSWDEGVTEIGSSGSGFWNSEKRLVGVLSGGDSSCDTPNAPDFYAHLAANYDVGSSATTNFKAWLDPSNTGVTQIDGIDGCTIPDATFSINPNPAEVNQNVTFTSNHVAGVGTSATYVWDFDGDGTTDSTSASAVFVYSSVYLGNVTLTVTTSEPCTGTASASIVVTPMGGNTPPNAVAAAAQTIANEGSTVQLDATGSTDEDGGGLSYAWTQIAGPVAVLVNASTATPSVTLPAVTVDTVVTFELTVTDEFNATGTDTVSLTSLNVNRAPNALVSNRTLSINEGGAVTLNAGASRDPDGDNINFAWTQIGGPTVGLSGAQTPTATFTAPQVTSTTALVFSVMVTDVAGLTDNATVTVTVNDVPPPVVTSSGGGGSLGVPLLALLAFTGYARRARRVFPVLFVVTGCSFLFACSTPETGSAATDSENLPGVVSTQTVKEGDQILLVKYGAEKSTVKVTNSEDVSKMVMAFNNRERRFEKIRPLFEYEMSIKVDNVSETWRVSPSGYIQKEQSYELYKMDVAVLKSYMK